MYWKLELFWMVNNTLIELKKLLKLSEEFSRNKNLDLTISNAKPPIFWKEKELVKKQIKVLSLEKLEDLLLKSNDLELSIKKNPSISTNILTNFILEEVA